MAPTLSAGAGPARGHFAVAAVPGAAPRTAPRPRAQLSGVRVPALGGLWAAWATAGGPRRAVDRP
ncbi:hypothetical protein [Streptomyces sp. NPDC059850]|uniref:hypothetical protein n=1 Tax=Streptomyces sp. NPDC059850 TaxID=3346970 RepID=UPI00364AF204